MINTYVTRLWALAASTGGPEALDRIFRALPADIPPVLVVQHMPPGFTKLFADRLDSLCPMEIREAEDGDVPRRGLVLVAPAERHMKLSAAGGKLRVSCFAGQRMHGVMPAADVLFESVAEIMGERGVGAVLTGMGRDGAQGLLAMRRRGARTICQDEESSVVYGMPKAAFELGAAEFVLPLEKIAEKLMEL
ncbi:MAG: CheB methylesterase domain-containing protein [Firmicutes bacterium]|nr:CheB methylesterase domain-containing protein [Bacillota bacterium]